MHLYEFLLECKKQIIIKHEIETIAEENEHVNKFQKEWEDLYKCLGE
jgi:hypothetical protein